MKFESYLNRGATSCFCRWFELEREELLDGPTIDLV